MSGPWDPDREWLAQRYESLSVAQIAEQAGVSPSTVHRAMVRLGIPRRSLSFRRGRDERLGDPVWLAARYATASMPEIAEELGVSAGTVRRALIDAGVRLRSSGGLRQRDGRLDDREWLVEQYRSCSLEEIAVLVGSSSQTVLRAMQRLGVSRRPAGVTRSKPFAVELLNDGEALEEEYRRSTAREVAAACGVSPETVARALDRHGIGRNQRGRRGDRPRPVELDDREWLAARYEKAWSVTEVADELGVDAQMVAGALRHFGIQVRLNRGSRHPELADLDRLREMVEENGTGGTAEVVGVARGSVQAALRRSGTGSPHRFDGATRLTKPADVVLVALWERHGSTKQVALEIGVSPTTARVWLASAGCFTNDVPVIARVDLASAIEAQDSVRVIAQRWSVTDSTVIIELHRHGLFESHRRRHIAR